MTHPEAMPKPESRTKTIVLWFVALGILIPGGYGFIEKLIQFIRTFYTEEGGGFTIIPITNYLIMASGFFCLLMWAMMRGMFHDIEKPKYTMLERELALQDQERAWEKIKMQEEGPK